MKLSIIKRGLVIIIISISFLIMWKYSVKLSTISTPAHSSSGFSQRIFLTKEKVNCRKTDPGQTQIATVFQQSHIGAEIPLIHVVITAKDEEGNTTLCGGDFFQAIMYSKNFSIAGHTLDFNNGTYHVIFYPARSGHVNISVALVNSRQEVEWFKTVWFSDDRPPLKFWRGLYTADNKAEETECWIAKRKDEETVCAYTNKVSLGDVALLCTKPITVGLDCSNLDTFRSFIKTAGKLGRKMLNRSQLFAERGYQILGKGPIDYHIQQSYLPSLRTCGGPTTVNSNHSVAHGYWAGGKWFSLECRLPHQWNVTSIYSCLRNKDIYFFGGSTIRQWYDGLSSIIENQNQKLGSGGFWCNRYYPANNINLTFNFQPFRIANRGTYVFNHDPFEVEVMDSLPTARCNYILAIAHWSHSTTWTFDTYKERLARIKASVRRFLARCPNTPVIIKGSKPREHSIADSQIHSSDWSLYYMNQILRETFDNVGVFLDNWDLNMAYGESLTNKNIHMPNVVIQEEVKLFLSQICPYT